MVVRSFSTLKRLSQGFVFDIDGVLLRGNVPLPGAREALLALPRGFLVFVLTMFGVALPAWLVVGLVNVHAETYLQLMVVAR